MKPGNLQRRQRYLSEQGANSGGMYRKMRVLTRDTFRLGT